MIIFLFLIETKCCNPYSESSRQDSSDEGSQHTFYAELIKITPNYHQKNPSYLELCLYDENTYHGYNLCLVIKCAVLLLFSYIS